MYFNPSIVEVEDVRKCDAEEGTVIMWMWWDGPSDAHFETSHHFKPYPRPVCEKLTDALLHRAGEGKIEVFINDLDASEELPADHPVRRMKFWMHTAAARPMDRYRQVRIDATWRQRRCFPAVVKWAWNAGTDKVPSWVPYCKRLVWEIEYTYAARRARHIITDDQGIQRLVSVVGYPMFQALANEITRKRLIRREGPTLHGDQTNIILNPQNVAVGVQRNWVTCEGNVLRWAKLGPPDVALFNIFMNDTMNKTGLPHADLGHVIGTDVTPSSFEVVEVYRVQCPPLWEAYVATREVLRNKEGGCGKLIPDVPVKHQPLLTMQYFDADAFFVEHGDVGGKLDPAVNEVLLLHGASKEVIDKVTEGGTSCMAEVGVSSMSERFADPVGMMGPGLYFADMSSKSNLYIPCPQCRKDSYKDRDMCECEEGTEVVYHMLVCRVLLGRVFQENDVRSKGMTYKSLESVQGLRNKGYDSMFVEMQSLVPPGRCSSNFREWCVYDGSQVYPEFVMVFKRLE